MPYAKEEAHKKIQKLVEDFHAQEATLEKAPEAQIENNLKYLSAILSSKLINFWCVNYLADYMNQSYLERIPIRALDFTDSAEKAQHGKMVALASQMLELHKSKARAKTQTETDLYERQIRAVDEQIDSLVYELYGLIEEERKIVEGKQS